MAKVIERLNKCSRQPRTSRPGWCARPLQALHSPPCGLADGCGGSGGGVGGGEVRFHAAFEEGWDHVAGPRVRTGVLLCEQGAHRPVAAASKFDPFAKKASSSSTTRRAASDRLQPAAAVKKK